MKMVGGGLQSEITRLKSNMTHFSVHQSCCFLVKDKQFSSERHEKTFERQILT